MGHSYYHAVSSARQFGGATEDYQEIHDFMDSSKAAFCDARHRAVLHNSFGVFLTEKVFGTTLTISTGKEIPVRLIAEQHIREDCGGVVPSLQDWLGRLPMESWMINGAKKLIEEPETDITEAAPRRRRVQTHFGGQIPKEEE